MERLSDWLDGELELDQDAAIRAHLVACEACSATVDDLRTIRHAARTAEPPPAPRDAWPRIARAVAEGAPGPPEPRRWPHWAAAAGAAALLGGGAVLGAGAVGLAGGAALGGGLDARGVAGILTVLVILVPAAAIAARIALKPFVDAYVSLRRDPSTEDEIRLLARRLDSLEREQDAAADEVRRLRYDLDGEDFMRRLDSGGRPPNEENRT